MFLATGGTHCAVRDLGKIIRHVWVQAREGCTELPADPTRAASLMYHVLLGSLDVKQDLTYECANY